jgi:hypothetical protein
MVFEIRDQDDKGTASSPEWVGSWGILGGADLAVTSANQRSGQVPVRGDDQVPVVLPGEPYRSPLRRGYTGRW